MRIEIGNVLRGKKIYAGGNEYPKVLASVGASSVEDNPLKEVEKAKLAQKYGADIVIDHTLTPNHWDVQKSILENVDIPLSAISVYDMASMVLFGKKEYYTLDDVLKDIEDKAKMGVDMLTIHAGVMKKDLDYFYNSERIIPCTSRGGTMVLENIKKTGKENFYYSGFDEILKIAKKYNVTISLGAIFRPASISDAVNNNEKYWEETKRNTILASKAKEQGVSIMIEGVGHCPMNLMSDVVKKSKEISGGIPYRVLTVATDSALGFDHVSSAISASTAVMAGADFVTAVSRSEHLGLPNIDDLKEAVISAKIACHCGYIGRTGDISLDNKMANARKQFGCRGSFDASIVPEMTKEALVSHKLSNGKKCTMCGEFCALTSSDRIRKN